MTDWKNHDLVDVDYKTIKFERRPIKKPDGSPAEGLNTTWITLDNPEQLNSYTTAMVKEVILGFRQASTDRACVAVVFTGAGDRAFCTGGNTKEYAEYYAGQPHEYRQYMRLFNDMITTILHCDKPVVCRANGMRIGGGQEMGMACDFTIAQDLARFGQAGPKHGSAPVGGSTDFLPLYVGIEQAMFSCTVCEPWSAHKAHRLGLLTDIVPALKADGQFVPNPMVHLDGVDERGRLRAGEYKTGDDAAQGKATFKSGTVDLSMLDAEVEKFCTKLMMTMPDCLTVTLENLRKHKLANWNENREQSRAWLSLNMMTEANAGFRAFNSGDKQHGREVNFPELRKRLAEGERWSEELIREVGPPGLRG